ncbi:MAG: hypothetical protein HC914_18405 [Chloroflexaceae bacterium]|nr:hypothetical protein [Chloroflexaceae bacterium]
MRHRWLFPLIICLLLFSTLAPVQAEIVRVEFPDDEEPREPILPEEEVERISMLQDLTVSFVLSPISPDDTTVLQATVDFSSFETQVNFLNIQDGSLTPAGDFLETTFALSNFAWRDGQTLTFVGFDQNFNPAVIYVDRTTGAISSTPLQQIPGFPVSLSPNGTRLLIAILPEEPLFEEEPTVEPLPEEPLARRTPARHPEPTTVPTEPPSASAPGAGSTNDHSHLLESPFDIRLQLRPSSVNRIPEDVQRLLKLQEGDDDTLEVASDEIRLSYFDLNTQEVIDLINLPETSGLTSLPAWSQDGSRLAITRLTFDGITEIFRGNTGLANTLVRDTLGQLPPAENPLLQGNVVDVFDLSDRSNVRVSQLRAGEGNGDTFGSVSWSTDNQLLMTKMQRPARLQGRTYPIYAYPESSYVRFYNNALQPVGEFVAPEIAAPNFMNSSLSRRVRSSLMVSPV